MTVTGFLYMQHWQSYKTYTHLSIWGSGSGSARRLTTAWRSNRENAWWLMQCDWMGFKRCSKKNRERHHGSGPCTWWDCSSTRRYPVITRLVMSCRNTYLTRGTTPSIQTSQDFCKEKKTHLVKFTLLFFRRKTLLWERETSGWRILKKKQQKKHNTVSD